MDDVVGMNVGKPLANILEPTNDLFLVHAILQLIRQCPRLAVGREDEIHFKIGHSGVFVNNKIVDAHDSRVL